MTLTVCQLLNSEAVSAVLLLSMTMVDSPSSDPIDISTLLTSSAEHDVFGNEENATIKYKTLSWPMVAVLMIAEIVSNGMLSLPAATAVVGIVPGVILIAFLGEPQPAES